MTKKKFKKLDNPLKDYLKFNFYTYLFAYGDKPAQELKEFIAKELKKSGSSMAAESELIRIIGNEIESAEVTGDSGLAHRLSRALELARTQQATIEAGERDTARLEDALNSIGAEGEHFFNERNKSLDLLQSTCDHSAKTNHNSDYCNSCGWVKDHQ